MSTQPFVSGQQAQKVNIEAMSSTSVPNIPSLQNVGTSSYIESMTNPVHVPEVCDQNIHQRPSTIENNNEYSVGLDVAPDLLLSALAMQATGDQPAHVETLPVADDSQYEHPAGWYSY